MLEDINPHDIAQSISIPFPATQDRLFPPWPRIASCRRPHPPGLALLIAEQTLRDLPERPPMQADTLLADKAFDADERVIEPLLAAGKKLVIPPKRNRKLQRLYDKEMYKARHLMENFYCKLKQYRAIATPYDKTARNFLAGIHLAAAVIWLN